MVSIDQLVFSVIDTETTSTGDHTKNKICEIAIIKTKEGRSITEYTKLLKPDVPISSDATRVHKITNDDVKDSPMFRDVASEIHEMIKGTILVCHNTSFDIPIIMRQFEESGIRYGNISSIDTVRLSRRAFPGLVSYGLRALVEHFQIDRQRKHRAFDDCMATVDIFWRCINKLSSEKGCSIHDILNFGRNKKLYELYPLRRW